MKLRTTVAGLLIALVSAAGTAEAQIFTPTYLAPNQSNDLGIHLSSGAGGGDGVAIEGIWRRGFGGYDLGLRAGVGEAGDDVVLLVGGEYRRPLSLDTAPIALAATGGAQVAIGDDSAFGLDAGLSIGSTFNAEGIAITPYLHPRIALLRAGDTDVRVLGDLGVDVEIPSGFILRLGIGFGRPTADFGFGFAWR